MRVSSESGLVVVDFILNQEGVVSVGLVAGRDTVKWVGGVLASGEELREDAFVFDREDEAESVLRLKIRSMIASSVRWCLVARERERGVGREGGGAVGGGRGCVSPGLGGGEVAVGEARTAAVVSR